MKFFEFFRFYSIKSVTTNAKGLSKISLKMKTSGMTRGALC